MNKTWALIGVLVLLGSAPQFGFASGGGGGMGGGMGGMGGGTSTGTVKKKAPKTPEEIAQSRYKSGLKARDEALEAEKKLAESEPGFWQNRYKSAVTKNWAEAIESYQEAVAKKPDFYQAHSDLGYALRKTGDYEKSLAAYGRALELNPEYPQALEYVGETYLGLKRLDDAKNTYMKLFGVDREQAALLMKAMNAWLEQPPTDGVTAEQVEAFRQWVKERQQLAEQVGGSSAHARAW
jgi:tetratricopeptide (TPR) repeat protein